MMKQATGDLRENGRAGSGRKSKKVLFVAGILALDVAVIWLLGETVLRVIPIPGIYYNVYRYDPYVGGGLYPHATEIYCNARGDLVKRKVNRWGYLDQDHTRAKPHGVYRIGFFGDSYTQARHVPLDQTFFRIVQKRLADDSVETLAIGVRGYSMLQSYLNSRRWVPFFDIDMVVYVFVENDLGDQLPNVDNSGDRPYPHLVAGGFEIDNSFRARNAYKTRVLYAAGDYLAARSLFFATVYERLKLLFRHGIKMHATEADRMMATVPNPATGLAATDLPSHWPADLRKRATDTGAAVLAKWRDEAVAQNKAFAVIYVPREGEFKKKTRDQDSWKAWIASFCKQQGIAFIDPSTELIAAENAGQRVFYDHFTAAGHKAFAGAFVKWFKATRAGKQANSPTQP